MNETFDDRMPFDDPAAERDWAKPRFREYLLGSFSQDETYRMASALALISGLMDELEDVETQLIENYLDGKLPEPELRQFETQYVHTREEHQLGKLKLREALRSPEVARVLEPPKPVLIPRTSPGLRLATAAAVVAAFLFGSLYYIKSRELDSLIADLNRRPRIQRPDNPPPEQPAGNTIDGLILSPGASGTTTVTVSNPPARLMWTPVPDYRASYRIRIYAATGEEQTSPSLTPKDNTIDYAPDHASALTLPWDVFILTPNAGGERALAHYVIRKP
jgi:hypothetical protein